MSLSLAQVDISEILNNTFVITRWNSMDIWRKCEILGLDPVKDLQTSEVHAQKEIFPNSGSWPENEEFQFLVLENLEVVAQFA